MYFCEVQCGGARSYSSVWLRLYGFKIVERKREGKGEKKEEKRRE